MLRKTVDIALLYLTQMRRNRTFLIQMLVMPLVLTFVLGQASESNVEANRPQHAKLNVVNEDRGLASAVLLNYLRQIPALAVQEATRQEAQQAQALADGDIAATLIIPADFSATLAAKQPVNLELSTREGLQNAIMVEQLVNAAVTRLSYSLKAADAAAGSAERAGLVAAADRQQYTEAALSKIAERWTSAPSVALQTMTLNESVTQRAVPQGINQISPGMLVMFTLFFVIGGGSALLYEREIGTLRRLLTTPITKTVLVVGKLLGMFLSGIVQMAILVGASMLFFNARWGNEPLAVVFLLLSFALAATCLSLMMASLVRSTAQFSALSTLVVLSMSALGGAWWPLEIVPDWMRLAGHALPTAWVMDGLNDLITRGLGLTAILQEIGVLLGFALFFLSVGIWRFRYE
jgi:ABC-2 type transport system permease protein